MTDVFTPEKRSEVMSKIRSKNTRPEETVLKWLFNSGFRYKKNVAALPGKPDVVLPKYRAAIFVHGCFWHGHEGCKYFVVPKTRTDWWLEKIRRNREKDDEAQDLLWQAGWRVFVLWECELRRKAEAELRLGKLAAELRSLMTEEGRMKK